ncbi:MAG: hypothetical protein JWM00_91 [Candidatus Saccharibacteria bacterium]|nr:hypothetical protein [Candidatus Saccharibacteria bacterium]
MAGSNPVVRAELVRSLEVLGSARGESLGDVRDELGMSHVTVTQFTKAVGSLSYKSGDVMWDRLWSDSVAQNRGHVLSLR